MTTDFLQSNYVSNIESTLIMEDYKYIIYTPTLMDSIFTNPLYMKFYIQL